MTTEIKIPVPDQTTEEVKILRWVKAVGDSVKRGEVILDIETEKSAIEVESSVDGVILEISAEPDQMVPVGKVVGYIGQPGEKPRQSGVGESIDFAQRSVLIAAAAQTARKPEASLSERKAVSPNARRMARENNIDISQIGGGSGPAGRVIGRDVAAIIANKAASSAAVSQTIEPTKMRRAIAGNLLKSWQMSPHFNVAMSIDMTRSLEFRKNFNESRAKTEHISINDLIVKGVACALEKVSVLNSSYTDNGIVMHGEINIGIATAVDSGLVVPVLVNTNRLSWTALGQTSKTIIDQARNGKVANAGKGTFTVSNLGMLDVDFFTAIINPPEAAILTIGRIEEKVVSINKMIAVIPTLRIVLCCDHRVIDGVVAAKFLGVLKGYLETDIAQEKVCA